MEGMGYSFKKDDSGLVLASRPRPRQRLMLVVCIVGGVLAAAAGAAASQPLAAVGVLVLAGAVAAYFYRNLLISSRERVVFEDDGTITWVKVNRFEPEESRRRIEDITPDAQGCLFKVSTMIHDAPGSRIMEGFPATVWIMASKGEGAGYKTLLRISTLKKEVERINEFLLENVPEIRSDQIG